MVTNTLQRDYDIARIIDDYERRISYLERQTLKLQPLITDTGWVTVPAAAGFTSALEVRLRGGVTTLRGTLLPNTDWGAANSLQQPVAAGGIPVEFRTPISLIILGGSGATSAANIFRIAVQSNGGIQVRCNTAAHTNSCSVNFDHYVD
jgi:hypothetical protein